MQRLPTRPSTSSTANGKAFPRYEPASPSVPTAPEQPKPQQASNAAEVDKDVFDSNTAQADNDTTEEQSKDEEEDEAGSAESGGSDLPIEIQSLMDRFLESLNSTSTSHQPLTADRLSDLYQDFYVHVESQIATHIAALATKLSREKSPTPSVSSQASAASRSSRRPARPSAKSSDGLSAHQMLTPTEITDKRKARRLLELKKVALEEAVEKGVCEKSYTRLWRHRSTDDDERDEKVRSRAAALRVVGVDLHELLTTAMGDEGAAGTAPPKPSTSLAEPQLSAARETLQTMNDSHYPAGKLKALKTTHKNIVEALSQMFPSTSSADEILPTLIYLLITSSPDSLNLVSNISFVQRFRTASKMDGEAAYCLTNLEAAITFLETVDLSSIRPNESKSTSRPSTPKTELPDPLYRGLSGAPSQDDKKSTAATEDSKSRQRTLSMILRAGPKPLGVAVDGADLAYDKIQSALDGSFKFFFGRMKEQQATIAPEGGLEVTAPKTLEDARKLVSDTDQADDSASIGEGSLAASENPSEDGVQARGKTLELIGGKKTRPRTRSLESNQSGGSGKRVGFVDGKQVEIPAMASSTGTNTPAVDTPSTVAGAASTAPLAGALAYNTAAESMRTIGNSLSRFSGWGTMRGFGKAGSPTTAPMPASPGATTTYTQKDAALDVERKVASQSPIDLSGVGPPIQRFIDLKEPKELNGYDTELLLRDYQRLAGILKALQQAQSGP